MASSTRRGACGRGSRGGGFACIPDFGNSTALVSISPTRSPPRWRLLERLLAHLRFRGIFSAEFKKDARDGAFRLLEVNVRPWWYVDFAETSGVEVVDLAYRDALGLPLRDILEYPVGRKCVYPYFDMAGYFDARKAGLNGSSEWPGLARCAATWLTANQPVFAWDDPRPAMTNLWMLCKRSFQTKILRRKS